MYKIGYIEENQAYLQFITRAYRLKESNPFFPKVHGIRLYENDHDDGQFVVAMERLKPVRSHGQHCAVELLKDLLERGVNSINVYHNDILGIETRVSDKLKQAVKILRSIRHVNDWGWDLGSQNMMMRGSQLVITDPFIDETGWWS